MDKDSLLQKLKDSKGKNTIYFVIFLIVSLSVFFISKFFNFNLTGVLLIFFLVIFSILCIITWFMAGIAIFRSLLVASASLSIVIFLARTYCDLPIGSHTANDALKSLFGFGLAYSALLFISSLKKELLGDKEKKGSLKYLEETYGGKKPWVILALYAIFIGLFLWQLYQVVIPIIYNLCIYQG